MEIWKLKLVNGRIPGENKDICDLEKGYRCDCVTYGTDSGESEKFAEKGGFSIYTSWKINMEPKKLPLFEKENHLPNIHFSVPC